MAQATEVKTNTCPQCGEQAAFDTYLKRYRCTGAQHGRHSYKFVGDSGYCNGNIKSSGSYSFDPKPCTAKGTPEPATRDYYDWATHTTVQVPNTHGLDGQESWEGLTFCKTHSPSNIAAKVAAGDAARHEEAERARRARANKLTTGRQHNADLARIVAGDFPMTEAQLEALAELVKLADEAVAEKARGPRW